MLKLQSLLVLRFTTLLRCDVEADTWKADYVIAIMIMALALSYKSDASQIFHDDQSPWQPLSIVYMKLSKLCT